MQVFQAAFCQERLSQFELVRISVMHYDGPDRQNGKHSVPVRQLEILTFEEFCDHQKHFVPIISSVVLFPSVVVWFLP
jgi:hypothetical protein